MSVRSTHKQILTGLVCLALWFGAVAPVLSQILRAGTWDPLQDICTTAKPASGAPGKPMPGGLSMQHCPYCMLHAIDLAPPPPSWEAALITPRSIEPPVLFLAAPHPLHAWASANPRAPPAHA